MGRIRKMIGALIHAPERFDLLAERIEQVHAQASGIRAELDGRTLFLDRLQNSGILQYDLLNEEVAEINGAERDFVRRVAGQLARDPQALETLNRGLKEAPAVMGDRTRLHIAETACVSSCLFQLSAGAVTVGEYVFAGYNVNLIAEKPDLRKTGLLRMEWPETDGCDIVIEDGAYIGSGSTLIGPCAIGKNAAVLPGSVVMPGAQIPENGIWGGIPAAETAESEIPRELPAKNPACLQLMRNNGGLLFLDGWSTPVQGWWKSSGRKLIQRQGRVLTDCADWNMDFYLEQDACRELTVSGPLGEKKMILPSGEGNISVCFPMKAGEISELMFSVPEGGGLTIALNRD